MNIWITPISLDDVNARCKGSFSDHLQIAFTDFSKTSLTAKMPIEKTAMQPMGIMHGGASAALAETVGSAAANYCVDQTKEYCVGLDLNINHLRPVGGGSIEGIASPLHIGSKTQVWEIKIYDANKKLVSIARLTLMVLSRGLPSASRVEDR